MATVAGAIGWEELRKQAQHLENEIDAKLDAFNKLGVKAGSAHSSSDTVPLLDEEHVFENMATEIESLFAKKGRWSEENMKKAVQMILGGNMTGREAALKYKLQKSTMQGSNFKELVHELSAVNDKMSEIKPDGGHMLHRIQRHREILKDYKLEFNKTQNNFIARRDREDLLSSVRKEIDNYKSGSGLNRRDQYLKESQHIHNSDRLVNDQISIAVETREHLVSQRHTFKRIQTRFNDISNRFPAVNSLLQRINIRKRRDSIILGLIIGFCTFLMLLYAFH